MSSTGIILLSKVSTKLKWVCKSNNLPWRLKQLRRFMDGGKLSGSVVPKHLLEMLDSPLQLVIEVIECSATELDDLYYEKREELDNAGILGTRSRLSKTGPYGIMEITHPAWSNVVYYSVFHKQVKLTQVENNFIRRCREIIRARKVGIDGGLVQAVVNKKMSFCNDFVFSVLASEFPTRQQAEQHIKDTIELNVLANIKALNDMRN